jgi:hypothetical protein
VIIAYYKETGKLKTTYRQYCAKAKEMVAKGLWVEETISLQVVKTIVKAMKVEEQTPSSERFKRSTEERWKRFIEDARIKEKEFLRKRYSS